MKTEKQKARSWRLSDDLIAARFWAKVARAADHECWEWQGRKTPKGYGAASVRSKPAQAHRVAWRLANGEIPPALFVLHGCDNPACCNPSHLRLGTHVENMDDRRLRNRTAQGQRLRSAKLSSEQVSAIRSSDGLQRDIAERFGVTPSQVSRIKANKSRRLE